MNSKNKIFKRVSQETLIPEEVIALCYKKEWEFIRNTIKDLPLKDENLKEDSFKELRTNFNLPGLGKLYTTYDKVSRLRRKIEILNKLKENKEG